LLGDFAGSLLNPLLNITLDAIRLFGSDQFNVLLKYRITGPPLVVYYIFLMLLSYAVVSKKVRRLTFLYVLLVTNVFVLWPLFGADEERRITIFSVPSGIVAVAHLERPQVILSNLPEKDYLYGERMIETYLINRRVVSPEIISLSGNPQNLKEILYFLEKDIAGHVYLPSASKNMFSDMAASDSTIGTSSHVSFYNHLPDSFNSSGSDIFLTDGLLCYLFDLSAILFIRRGGAGICNDLPDFLVGREIIVVTPRPEYNHPAMSGSIAGGDVKYIICNRRPVSTDQSYHNIMPVSADRPDLVELSQVGAVELVIKNGRIQPVKQHFH
jgi:hypothetical protein